MKWFPRFSKVYTFPETVWSSFAQQKSPYSGRTAAGWNVFQGFQKFKHFLKPFGQVLRSKYQLIPGVQPPDEMFPKVFKKAYFFSETVWPSFAQQISPYSGCTAAGWDFPPTFEIYIEFKRFNFWPAVGNRAQGGTGLSLDCYNGLLAVAHR